MPTLNGFLSAFFFFNYDCVREERGTWLEQFKKKHSKLQKKTQTPTKCVFVVALLSLSLPNATPTQHSDPPLLPHRRQNNTFWHNARTARDEEDYELKMTGVRVQLKREADGVLCVTHLFFRQGCFGLHAQCISHFDCWQVFPGLTRKNCFTAAQVHLQRGFSAKNPQTCVNYFYFYCTFFFLALFHRLELSCWNDRPKTDVKTYFFVFPSI